jgi:5,10-methylenetetrahydromethanopterin reductase
VLSFGTVLGEGEDPGAQRVMDAAGHGAAVSLHAMHEAGADVTRFPGGADWLAAIEAIPEAERHLALHDLHLIGLTERDARVVSGDLVRQLGFARTASEWRTRLADLEANGATEIAYQPAGPDIPGELRRFAHAAGL